MTKWKDKTRDGTTYRIIGRMTDPCGTRYPVLGEVQEVSGVWTAERWTDDGEVLGDGNDRSHDLIPIFIIDITGWYKTRDGRRVLIGWIDDRPGIDYPCGGRIDRQQNVKSWNRCGNYHYEGAPPVCTDIVAKWEDE